jgi:hypothetical protein
LIGGAVADSAGWDILFEVVLQVLVAGHEARVDIAIFHLHQFLERTLGIKRHIG